MRAIDKYTWVDYEEGLKSYLGISDFSEDFLLKLWLSSASEDMDSFLGWYFTDKNGDLQDTTPDSGDFPSYLDLGLYEYVRALRERHQRTTSIGVMVVKTGALSESYGSSLDFSIGIKLARAVAYPLWVRSKVNLLLGPN